MKTVNQTFPLDELDIKILAALQRNGRITKAALAEDIGLSTSPCWNRLKRLEDAGYIKSYCAEINFKKLAPVTEIWTQMVLSNHRLVDLEKFEKIVQPIVNISECWGIGGEPDYLLKFVVSDIDHYERLIRSLLHEGVGIERYYTYIVTKTVKHSIQPPLKEFLTSP